MTCTQVCIITTVTQKWADATNGTIPMRRLRTGSGQAGEVTHSVCHTTAQSSWLLIPYPVQGEEYREQGAMPTATSGTLTSKMSSRIPAGGDRVSFGPVGKDAKAG